MNILAVLTATVFLGMSVMHAYWAFGGRRGTGLVIPTVNGRRTLNPSSHVAMLIAVALAVAAALALGSAGILHSTVPAWLIRSGLVGLSLVFGLRAVGDFRLIGFTKRIKDTGFACLDTTLFSPLCVGLSVACAVLAWFAVP
jgi:L-asparagine transporter-like permease